MVFLILLFSGNFAPTINASSEILVTLGEAFTYNILVNDSNGDDITVSSSLNTSAQVTGPNAAGEVEITFTLQQNDIPENATDFSFTVRAKVGRGIKEGVRCSSGKICRKMFDETQVMLSGCGIDPVVVFTTS